VGEMSAWAIFGPKDEWLCKVGHTEDGAWERISGAGYIDHYKQLGYTCRQITILTKPPATGEAA